MSQVIHPSTGSVNASSARICSLQSAQGGYAGANGSTSTQALDVPWSAAGTMQNLSVRLRTASGSGISSIFTLWKNNAATALTVTLADAATSATDSTHTVSIAAGDVLHIRRTTSGGTPPESVTGIGLEFTSTTAGRSCYTTTLGNVFANVGREVGYAAPWASNLGNLWDGDGYIIDDAPQTVTVLEGDVLRVDATCSQAAISGDQLTIRLIKNGIVQDGTGGTVDTTFVLPGAAAFGPSAGSWSGTLPVSASDRLAYELTFESGLIDSGNGIVGVSLGLCIQADDTSTFMLGMQCSAVAAPEVRYGPPTESGGLRSTEADASLPGIVTTWYLGATDSLAYYSGGTYSVRCTARLNAGDTAVVETMTTSHASLIGLHFISLCDFSAPGGSYMTVTSSDVWDYAVLEIAGGCGFVFGVETTVTASRAVAFGLDGNTNVLDESGKFKIFGDFEVTGTTTLSDTTTLSEDLDALGT